MNLPKLRAALRDATREVERTYAARSTATHQVRTAEADVLDVVRKELGHLVPVLAGRYVVAALQPPGADQVLTHSQGRGILLAGMPAPKRSPDGMPTGRALYLLEDLSLSLLEYAPPAATASPGWSSTQRPISSLDALTHFRLVDVLDQVAELLPAAAASNSKAAATYEQRAARLNALLLLARP
ncbi:hypothetical protein [Corallococcus sp. AB038B]|uniref:hypothetical protein n=1 Tax=Corallococcus sp. AB038B TaxID=2316718 RepID=UPI000EC4579A|nr:hypothetical protein [Corallococcus sp. AB038B]RKH92966.1 hypothetical protein D7Y04_41835 [Corallococcus sp. AB038B]